MFLPIRSKNPPESLPIVTCLLILINTVVYVGTSDHGTQIREDVMLRWGMLAESSFHDYERAWAWYQHVLDRWPMGHLAPQAKARMEALSKIATPSS